MQHVSNPFGDFRLERRLLVLTAWVPDCNCGLWESRQARVVLLSPEPASSLVGGWPGRRCESEVGGRVQSHDICAKFRRSLTGSGLSSSRQRFFGPPFARVIMSPLGAATETEFARENNLTPAAQTGVAEAAIELTARNLENGEHGTSCFKGAGAAVYARLDEGMEEKGKDKSEQAQLARKLRNVPYYQLFKYADKLDVLLVIGGTVAAIVEGASLPVFFLVFGKLIDSLGTYHDQPSILADKVNKYCLSFVYLGLVVLVSSYVDVSLWMWTGERQSSRLRSKYLRAILRQDVGYFEVGTSSGEVVSRVNDGTLLVQDAVGEKVGNFTKNMATFVAGFVVGCTQVWQLTLVLFAVTPLLATPGLLYARALKGLSSRNVEAYADAGRIVEESLSAVRTVYSFAAEERAERAYEVALQKTYQLGLKASLAKGLALGAQSILFFAWALMFWYGSVLVIHGDANGGSILATSFAVIVGGLSLGQAIPNLKNFAEGCAAAHEIFQMIDRIPAIDSEDLSGKQLESVQGNIEFRNVSFNYPARPDVPIFECFSLAIPSGRHVALVGSSGSGKSTVIQLLERFYDPTGGGIFLDGHNIASLQLKWLRQQYGLVSQEPALFATSIKENILYGKANATQEEIESAAKAANAHTFIAGLPQGYDTQVGDRGVQLSGGQKQRVAIARAILKQPRILLLDEATSALDSASEAVVQEALTRLMVARTTVVIAHRLSTIRCADVIAVVQKGEVVEQGSHADLIARGTAYASLVKLQEIREDHDEGEPLDGSPGLGSPVNSFQRETSGLSTERSGLGQPGVQLSVLGDDKTGDPDPKVGRKAPRPSFWRLLALNKPEWAYMLVGTVGAIAAGLVYPFWALIMSTVTSVYYNTDIEQMKHDVTRYCYIFIGLGAGGMLATCTEHFCYGAAGEALTKRVRGLMLKTLLRQEVAFFDSDENSPGALAARVGSDAQYVRAVVGDRMYLIVQALSGIVASIGIGLVLEWKLALVLLATFPLLTMGAVMENLVLRGFSDQNAKAQESASQVALGAVGNIRTVSAFAAEDKVLALFNDKLEVPRKLSFRRGQTSGLGLGLSQFFFYASWALALWYGTQLVKNDGANFADVLKVFLVIVSVGFGVAEAASLAPDVAKGGTATESVFEVLDRRTAIDPDANADTILDKLEGAIELRNVTFSYPTRPDAVIFNNFNLTVAPGLTVALVGQSGSGKSTIISLIQRFYVPASGMILIDGEDIATLHLKTLRSQIGLVSQEPTLFSGTIKSNILYGNANASEAEIVEAARAANAHNFISALPNGYDTHVGEKGVQLSGGQKQRIAIARAAIKSPRILLLDEATSALDTKSERVVQEALDRLMVGRTTLVIAHRLSTVHHADVIAVVQEGAIVEQGSHEQLIAKGEGGAYYSLVNILKKGPL